MRLISLFTFISFALLGSTAFAQNLVVFGDSINDTDNLRSVVVAQGGAFPPEAFGGRASNGFVAVEVAAKLLGEELKASLFPLGQALGGNYAVAGARARAASEQPIHLSQQVDAFLAAKQGQADLDSVYIVYIGGNDVLDAYRLNDTEHKLYKRSFHSKKCQCGRRINKKSGEFGILKDALNAIDTNVQKLIDAGARKIVVANSFDISAVPDIVTTATKKELAKAAFLSCKFNKKLAKRINELNKQQALNIVLFDFEQVGKTILENSQAFGFANTQQACLTRDGFTYTANDFCDLETDIDSFLFFDGLHFSAFGHEYIGRALYSVLPR